jgi:hypothetical protein
MEFEKHVLIIGSGPNAVSAVELKTDFDAIVVINNAWRVRPDWTHLIYPFDFPKERWPQEVKFSQSVITEKEFVPIQNQYGGFIYAGATMAFTAGYWVLGALRPSHISFIGCDMHYPRTGKTHFYGNGTPDPLRDDISLMSLKAKSNRFLHISQKQNCLVGKLSDGPSELTFPRINAGHPWPKKPSLKDDLIFEALKRENELGYLDITGRYWQNLDRYDRLEIKKIDNIWEKIM